MNVLGRKVDRMTHQVTAKSNIDFGATGVDEILQNVAYILSTFVMSYPDKRERDRKKSLKSLFILQRDVIPHVSLIVFNVLNHEQSLLMWTM